MSTDTTLAIAGVALTVIFGLWSLAIARRAKYPGKISVFFEYCAALFGRRAQETPGLEISFRGDEISNPLVMLKLILLNDGHIDIRKDMIERGLTFELPQGYSWKEVTVTESSPEVIAKPTILGSTLTMSVSLFRKGEAFSFEALVEVPRPSDTKASPAQKLRSSLQISHRISETAQPQLRAIQTRRDEKSKFREMLRQLGLLGLSAFILFVAGPSSKLAIGFVAQDSSGELTTVHVSAKDEGTQSIEVEFSDGTERELTLEEFATTGTWAPAVIRKPLDMLAIHLVLMTLMSLPPLLSSIELRRIRRTRKALERAGFSPVRSNTALDESA